MFPGRARRRTVLREARKSSVLERFELAEELWSAAMRAHRLAPPDQGFTDRLRALSTASSAQASVMRDAAKLGLQRRPPARAHIGVPPYELRPHPGRRGPVKLWARFDQGVNQFNRAAALTRPDAMAAAHAKLSAAARALAEALDAEDAL
jgi:hypothetical protein